MKNKIKAVYFNNYKPTERTKEFLGETDQVFEEFYKLNNSLRYCNGSYWKFEEQEKEQEYSKWRKSLSRERSFNLYYGNGVVD